MAFKVDGPAEAYAAVFVLVVGADGLGTMEERAFLFEELGRLDVFEGYDAEGFGGLLGAVMGRLLTYASDDGASFSDDAINGLCTSAREVLDAPQRDELFSAAVGLACTDGLAEAERALLMRLGKGLGLDETLAGEVIARAAG